MKVELIPNRHFNSTAILTDPNQASPPIHPPFLTFAPSACQSTSATCFWINSPCGRWDFISQYFLEPCCQAPATMLWYTINPMMHSQSFLIIAPKLTGLRISKVMLGNPPVCIVFSFHPLMDSSRTMLKTSVIFLLIVLFLLTNG
jgi:hypothetical protein